MLLAFLWLDKWASSTTAATLDYDNPVCLRRWSEMFLFVPLAHSGKSSKHAKEQALACFHHLENWRPSILKLYLLAKASDWTSTVAATVTATAHNSQLDISTQLAADWLSFLRCVWRITGEWKSRPTNCCLPKKWCFVDERLFNCFIWDSRFCLPLQIK